MAFPAIPTEGPLCTSDWLFLSEFFIVGKGSPAGVVKARIGALYLREDGEEEETLYIKESGEGTVAGWTAIAGGGEGGGFATVEELVEEAEARAAADAAEAGSRASADSAEATARESADSAEKSAREAADAERTKGPASATNLDIAVFDGATGKLLKDGGKTVAQVLERANHTGTQLAATISNFDTQVRTSRLDQMATPTANVPWGEKKITSLADPTENLDAANKEYVDAAASAAAAGLSLKNPVSYASTANVTVTAETATTLEGNCPLPVDGTEAFGAGTRLLLKDQSTGKQNGIFEVTKDEAFGGVGKFGEGSEKFGEGSKWLLTRTTDADTEAEVKQGMMVPVTLGASNAKTSWVLITENPVIPGTTAMAFVQWTATPVGPAGGDLTGTYPNPAIAEGAIVNADVNAAAAIAYGKLNLATSIVNADVNAAAAIAYSKLNLASSLKSSDLSAGIRQYGLVTALPTEPTPSAGDVCHYQADKTNGVIWMLVYDGEGEFKWKYVGGPPLYAFSNTNRTLNNTAYTSLPTDPLSITVALKGDYDIKIEALVGATAENRGGRVSYAIGGTVASDNWCAMSISTGATSIVSVGRETRQTGVAASAKIEEKARCEGAYEMGFNHRRLSVRPVRVG